MTRIARIVRSAPFAAILLSLAGLGLSTSVHAAARVESFSPQGGVKDVRQVVARFSEPMVSFGDPRSEAPFDVTCGGKGRGRWADARNWIYDFDADLPGGLRCSFALKASVKTAAGNPVTAARFEFTTGGPAIRTSWPEEGDSTVDEHQIFLLGLDAAVDPKSVREHAACVAEGVGERIPLTVVEGKERDQVLAEQKDRARQFFAVLTKRGATGILAVKDKRLDAANKVLVVRCGRPMAPGTQFKISWDAGIRTPDGIVTTETQSLPFGVREEFRVTTSCTRVNPDAGCIPALPVTVNFSAPVPREVAAKLRLKSGAFDSQEPVFDDAAPNVESLHFAGPFPPKATLTLALPDKFADDAKRPPANAASFPLKIVLDENPPLVKFPSRFGVLEAKAEPMLPVSVRNVEGTLKGRSIEVGRQGNKATPGRVARLDLPNDQTLAHWLARILRAPEEDAEYIEDVGPRPRPGEKPLLHGPDAPGGAQSISLPAADAKTELQLIGVPLPKPGLFVVEFASQRLGQALHGENIPYYVSAGALVTNLAVHFKQGRESSLVWVTQLDDAAPVAGAKVRISDCLGVKEWEGVTDAKGIARVNAEIPKYSRWEDCRYAPDAHIVSARKDADFSFTLSSWRDGISPWQFNLAGGSSAGPVLAHTVTDRPLYRAGETVSMKHFLRLHTGEGFGSVKPADQPRRVELEHEGSGQRYKVDIRWGNNAGESTWQIPKDAKLGSYTLRLVGPRGQLQSGSFRVEQFRVPLMRAVLKPPAEPNMGGGKIDVDAQLSYLSGGPAGGAPVKIRSRLVPYPLVFADYDDFRFGGRVPEEGIHATQNEAWDPDADYADEGDAENSGGENATDAPGGKVQTRELTLDAQGGARIAFDKLAKPAEPKSLEVEMEYSDPNGQILTTATRALVLPSSLVLGIRTEGSYATRDSLAFKVLALDTQGKPQADRKLTVDVYTRAVHAYRKRLLGGFYAYEQSAEVRKAGVVCKGTTDKYGLLSCKGASPADGQLILVAKGEDAQGNGAIASREVYVAAGDDWFDAGASDRIDILADKRSYEPGETARFEVRMPFREAMALVTVEREGVLASFTTHIDAKSPFVEVPIAKEYGPNAYVSVLVVRGRIAPETPGPFAWLKRMVYKIGMFLGLVDKMPKEVDTRPTALVDLTKPAFRMGLAQIRVGWDAYALKVKVEADKTSYRVRDIAQLKVTVTDAAGKPAANSEVALAAVDEGLLALAPPTSWDLLAAMMERRPIEVETSTMQAQVVGKRHFGKKAAAPGGGGGAGANARELFDTLLLWQGRVQLDANGQASIGVPLNDSLTSFRVEAIAHAGVNRFGSGRAILRTTQEAMLFAGIPPFVREGDHFDAMVTVRNGGERPLTLDLTASYATADANTGAKTEAGRERVSLNPGEAKTVSFKATAPFNATKLDWEVSAQEVGSGEKLARDALKLSQTVGVANPVRVYQQTLEQLTAGTPWRFPVALPKGAVPGRGGVDIRLARSLGGGADAIRAWMQRYPYVCLEQQASKAIVLDDEARWKGLMNALPTYLDRDGLARYFPTGWLEGDDALTVYLLALAQERGWDIPDTSRDRMTKGLTDFVAGRVVRYGAMPTVDLAIRKIAAIDALARYGQATPEMLQSIEIAPNLWPSSAVIDWLSLLGRMDNIPDRARKLEEARQILRSRLTFSGTTLTFSTEKSDYLWWLMVSPDVNAVRALLQLTEDPAFEADVPRLARGALARQQEGRWRTTVANAWGTLALARFQQRFEREPVTGNSAASLAGAEQVLDWAKAKSRETNDPTLGTPIGPGLDAHFDWPAQQAELSLEHRGGGKPWAFVTSRASLPLEKPLFAGYQVQRTVTPVEQKTKGQWSRGDTYRVKLEIDAQNDMTWVVVNDPVPAGASILGSGLGGDSAQLASGEKATGWSRPAFEERAFDGYRAYYRYLPKGKVTLEYTVRLNNVGQFEMPASRVEAMYAPEIFGELPVGKIEVKPQ